MSSRLPRELPCTCCMCTPQVAELRTQPWPLQLHTHTRCQSGVCMTTFLCQCEKQQHLASKQHSMQQRKGVCICQFATANASHAERNGAAEQPLQPAPQLIKQAYQVASWQLCSTPLQICVLCLLLPHSTPVYPCQACTVMSASK